MLKEEKQFKKEYGTDWADKVNWSYISRCQKLSEKFIEKYSDKVKWSYISEFQKLSEKFIEKYSDKVNWSYISRCQKLSEKFIEKYSDKVDKDVQLKNHHREYDPIKDAKEYAKKYNLKIEDGYLYAFRNHDQYGRGAYNKTIYYTSKDIEYRDWHCDLDFSERNSFGLGIFPEGNTEVKVKVEDFGCEVDNDGNRGKARVWAFSIV